MRRAPARVSRGVASGVRRIVFLVLALGVPSCQAWAHEIDLVLSGDAALYGELAGALERGLEAGSGDRGLRVTRRLAADPRPAAPPDLRVAVGMEACEAALDTPGAGGVLCPLVPRAGFERLPRAGIDARVSAIYLDQPVARQLALARALLPGARRVGFLAGPQVRRKAALIREAARAAGFQADLVNADGARDAAQGIERLVARNDLILAVYDAQVLTPATAKWLLHLAYQQGRPVLGFSRAYVTAGAVASVYSTPAQIGRQAADWILAWHTDGLRDLPAAGHPVEFEVAVNRPVARSLGLDPPSEAELARAVRRLTGGPP